MKSLKNQLLLIFSGFVIVSVLTSLYTAYYYKHHINKLSFQQELLATETTLLKALKEQENYFSFETINVAYFKTKESKYLEKYDSLYLILFKSLEKINSRDSVDIVTNQVKAIKKSLLTLDTLFTQVQKAIIKRGFINFGLIGEMRSSVHLLEDIPELSQTQILMLRRHEKDFLLRQEQLYLDKHGKLINQIIEQLYLNPDLTALRKKQIIAIVQEYARLFEEVRLFETIIGLKLNTGYKKKLGDEASLLVRKINELNETVEEYQLKKGRNFKLSFIVIWVLYLTVVFWLSSRIAKKFTKRLSFLSDRINYFVNSNFTSRLTLEPNKRKDEVGKLWNNFIKMEKEIVEYIDLFKEKVYEKTLELSEKNVQIELQKNELQQQKEETDQKNKDLTDGLRYAWRIQGALLPDHKKLKKQLEKGFVFFEPKEIVSGDIYWTYKPKSKNQKESIFSVIDCTGHGVPGAFMSILAINALNYSVINKQNYQPSKILQATNNYVYKTMKYYNTDLKSYQLKDGMDMLLCRLSRKTNKLEYSGANRPLYIVRKQEESKNNKIGLEASEYKIKELSGYLLYEIKPTKKTVGTQSEKESLIFENKIIDIEQGDMVYLTSDGYADQFGGPNNKKFMMNRLKNLFTLIHDLKEEEQKRIIQQTIIDWKGEAEQVDDITIMGVRV